ncbi:MAG: DUF86 domain-containing protein [Clostridia bacterium]
MQHRDKTILLKILSELNVALEMIKEKSFEEFDESELLKRAMCMTVINIGELVKALTEDFKLENNYIPWKSIAGFRDIAAHKYQTLHMEDVYYTVTTDFPQLKDSISEIFNKEQ